MTVVMNQGVKAAVSTRVAGRDHGIDDADEVPARYLDCCVDPARQNVPPRDDPSSIGLVQAIWTSMCAMTESAALWWALSLSK